MTSSPSLLVFPVSDLCLLFPIPLVINSSSSYTRQGTDLASRLSQSVDRQLGEFLFLYAIRGDRQASSCYVFDRDTRSKPPEARTGSDQAPCTSRLKGHLVSPKPATPNIGGKLLVNLFGHTDPKPKTIQALWRRASISPSPPGGWEDACTGKVTRDTLSCGCAGELVSSVTVAL